MIEKIRVRNLETGEVGLIRRKLYESPRFNPGILVEVEDGAKSYVPELYKSKFPPADESQVADEEDAD